MPRKARIDAPGALHHVMVRGIERRKIFQDDKDLKYQLHSEGYDLEKVAKKVAKLYELNPQDIYESGKDRWRVEARSLFCYWAIRELGVAGMAVARKLGVSQPTVSISVKRGEKVAKAKGLKLLPAQML